MTRLVLAFALVLSVPATPSFGASRYDAYVACYVGNAAVSLHHQSPDKTTTNAAIEKATAYATKRCKDPTTAADIASGSSEGLSDYVYHSVRVLEEEWFGKPK